jgi:hypothetical protein
VTRSGIGKKVVLATFGTLGDIYPFIAIASALQAHRAAAALRSLASGDHAATTRRFAETIATERGVDSVVDWAEDMTHTGPSLSEQNRMTS